jgi:hypothetical protein
MPLKHIADTLQEALQPYAPQYYISYNYAINN